MLRNAVYPYEYTNNWEDPMKHHCKRRNNHTAF